MTSPRPDVPAADGPPPRAADPLAMARNCAAAVDRIAAMQASDDPDVQLQAYIARTGQHGYTTAIVGGCMALVSIASDLRRVADVIADDDPRPPYPGVDPL